MVRMFPLNDALSPIVASSATKNTLPPWAPFSSRMLDPFFAFKLPATLKMYVPAALPSPSSVISPFSSAAFKQYTPGPKLLPVRSELFISVHGSCFIASIELASSFVDLRPVSLRRALPLFPLTVDVPRSTIPFWAYTEYSDAECRFNAKSIIACVATSGASASAPPPFVFDTCADTVPASGKNVYPTAAVATRAVSTKK